MLKKIAFASWIAILFIAAQNVPAQTAVEGWLKYQHRLGKLPISHRIRALGDGKLNESAVRELVQGLNHMFGSEPSGGDSGEADIVLGSVEQVLKADPRVSVPADLGPDGFWISQAG